MIKIDYCEFDETDNGQFRCRNCRQFFDTVEQCEQHVKDMVSMMF